MFVFKFNFIFYVFFIFFSGFKVCEIFFDVNGNVFFIENINYLIYIFIYMVFEYLMF